MDQLNFFSRVLVILCLLYTPVTAQSSIPEYHQQTDFLLASPGAFGNGLLGYVNPAVANYLHGPDFRFLMATDQGQLSSFDRWGLFYGTPHMSFGMIQNKFSLTEKQKIKVTDYRIALGFGSDAYSVGVGYGWSSGDLDQVNRDKLITLGTLVRPNRFLSVGLSGNFAWHKADREGVVDVALRPLGTDLMTLFGDLSLQKKDQLDAGKWSFGTVIQALPGIHLTARYFDTQAFTAGLSFSFGNAGVITQAHFPKGEDLSQVYYGVRAGAKEHNIFDPYFFKDKKYLSLNLKGRIYYQKYRLFDKETHTLAELLSHLQAVIDDPTVTGVALNLSGMNVSRELAWEIREKLIQVRQADKRVVIYLDRGGMTEYHLASVADHVILDPEGMLALEGYLMGRTFLKGTLEKLGLGYDEWRFFKYKSAAEALSRDQMSDADREQRQAFIDDLYAVVRADICSSRKFDEQKFDDLINNKILFLPKEVVALGLVDTLARWVDIEKIIESVEGKKKGFIRASELAKYQLPPRHWGEKPQIAVVYGLGECDMERGINARKLEKVFKGLEKNKKIKAVVFRVDSPGGDGLASDLVAEALRKCAEKKPVIISQGNVAGSGGYWISMYGDSIVAAPFTITGSIGVIGGWIWNNGIGAKLGMTSDHVKVGDHADLGFGIQLPFLGIQIPDRNLNTEERAKIESLIIDFYKAFVAKVADGRKMSVEAVETVAQGRIFSGIDGKENGLVDVLGGLETAIALAKKAAGIPEDKEVDLIELPKLGLFNPEIFMPSLIGINIQKPPQNDELEYLKLIARYPGQPLPIMPPDLQVSGK